MNERTSEGISNNTYGVYRYFNSSKNEICFVVAVGSEEADEFLESDTPAAVSHWNFSDDGDVIIGDTMREGLPEVEARRWAQHYEEEYGENPPLGFWGSKVKPINQPSPADPAAGAGENTTQP